jgi:hypothetical protein
VEHQGQPAASRESSVLAGVAHREPSVLLAEPSEGSPQVALTLTELVDERPMVAPAVMVLEA